MTGESCQYPSCYDAETGKCNRHGVHKTKREVDLCLNQDCSERQHLRYWQAWEDCKFPAQECNAHYNNPVQVETRVKQRRERNRVQEMGRPGTKLKEILATWGIYEKAGCQCKQIARSMDNGGPDWCEENMESLVGKLEAEAKRRGSWVFSRRIARRLIRKAVKKARREIAK